MRFSDVRPGSPAAKAGLKAGDILVQFGDKPIHNLYDFTDALRRSKVGQVVVGESVARRSAGDGERDTGGEEVGGYRNHRGPSTAAAKRRAASAQDAKQFAPDVRAIH